MSQDHRPSPPASEPAAPAGHGLVVDDEQPMYETYCDILSPVGYRVEWAADRDSALADPDMAERAYCDGAYDYLQKDTLKMFRPLLRMKVSNASELARERRNALLKKFHQRAVMAGNGH